MNFRFYWEIFFERPNSFISLQRYHVVGVVQRTLIILTRLLILLEIVVSIKVIGVVLVILNRLNGVASLNMLVGSWLVLLITQLSDLVLSLLKISPLLDDCPPVPSYKSINCNLNKIGRCQLDHQLLTYCFIHNLLVQLVNNNYEGDNAADDSDYEY